MDLLTLIAKFRDLAAALKAGDWLATAKIAFEIGLIVLPLLPQPRPLMGTMYASKTDNELAAEIEACCNRQMAVTSAGVANAAPGGPFINLMWPLLVEALLRILANLK